MVRRVGVALLLLAWVFVIFAVGELSRTYGKARDFSERIYEPLQRGLPAMAAGEEAMAPGIEPAEPEQPVKIDDRHPFTLLLIGVDRRKGDAGRADALIVAAVNPAKRATIAVSIPRDTRTRLSVDGRDRVDKINHAYAYGGVNGTVATIEDTFGIEIDYYMKADMEGFQAVVDILGGVQVDNDRRFEYEGHTFTEGALRLTGEEALAFVRMRYDDPRGDLGRGDRQRAVLRSIVDKVLMLDGAGKLSDIFDKLPDYIKTNVSFEDWKSLALHYRDAAETIRTERINGTGAIISGIYYYMAADEELDRVGALIRDHLQTDAGPGEGG